MTSVLSIYVTRLFLARLFVVLFGLTILVVLLDLLANSDEIVDKSQEVVAALGRYTALRLPGILAQIIPMSVLLAGLITLVGLARHSELTAIFGAGLSRFRLIGTFLPAVFLIAAVQFLIEDQVLPPTVSQLRAWGVGDYDDFTATDRRQMIWIRQGDNFVRVHRTSVEDGRLFGVTIFHRNGEGNLLERIEAEEALYADGTWTLQSVTRTRPGETEGEWQASLSWPQALDSSVLRLLSLHPRELSWAKVRHLAEESGFGNRPAYLYEVWLHKKIARPLATVLLVLLAVASVQRIDPRRQPGLMFAAGISVGFLYWVFDELVVTVGEAGLLPPTVAAWVPPLVLGAAATTVILRHDGH